MSRRHQLISHQLMRTPRILATLLIACGIIVPALTGCGAGQVTQTDSQVAVIYGTDGDIGNIALRDVLILYPDKGHGSYPVGSNAPLHFTIVNQANTADELVSVTTSAARTVRLEGSTTIPAGRVVTSVDGVEAVEGATASPTPSPSPTEAPGAPPTEEPGLPPVETPGLPPVETPAPPPDAHGALPTGTPSPLPPGTPGLQPTETPNLPTEPLAVPPAGTPSAPPTEIPNLPPAGIPGVPPSGPPSVPPPTASLDFGELRIVLVDLTRELRPGRNVEITFTFRNAGTVTLPIPMGPPNDSERQPLDKGDHS